MYAKKNSGKKMFVAMLAIALLIGCTIGGTIAWLMDTTPTVTNTFTVGDVEITLVESPYDNANKTYGTPAEGVTNTYPLIPGNTYKKDPKVSVTANSEDCYLFVKLDKVNNPDTYLTYTLNTEGWTALQGEDGVYYRSIIKSEKEQSWDLLTADTNGITVTVKDTIVRNGTATNDTVDMPTAAPQLVFTAYAVQSANRTVEQAWSLVDPTPAANP